VTVTNAFEVSSAQTAGTYTGTISYAFTPVYSGSSPSC
jgi:hypothetical protein